MFAVDKTQEEFDAMNDCAFCDWWDVWFEKQQASATSEEEVEAAHQQMVEAQNARWDY